MAFERVMGPGPVAPMPALARTAGRAEGCDASPHTPRPEDLMQLEVAHSAEGELLMSGPAGQRFRLSADSLAGLTFEPGQVLLVKVLATSPRLELALIERLGDTPPPPSSPPDTPQARPGKADIQDTLQLPALQIDQAAMRRFAQALPDAPSLATRWLALANQALHQQQQADTLGSMAQTDATANTAAEAFGPLACRTGPRSEADPFFDATLLTRPQQTLLLWQALSPQGLPLAFCLWRPARGEPGARATDTALTLRLRLLLRLPQGGMVLIDMGLSPPGVLLTLSTDQAALVPGLRGRLSLLAGRLAGAGLRLMRCHVQHGTLPGFAAPAPNAHLALARHPLPPALFRAAAEALVVLSPPFR